MPADYRGGDHLTLRYDETGDLLPQSKSAGRTHFVSRRHFMKFLHASSAEDAAAYESLFSDHTSDCYDRLAVSASVVRNAPGAALRFDDISVSVIERNVA